MRVYKESWRFLKQSKLYFFIVSLVFLASILIGFIFPVFFAELIEEFIKKILEQTSGMNFWQLLLFILQNNITTAFLGMVLGIFLGIFPVFTSFLNGYVLGFIMNKTADSGIAVFWRLVPHGIFEIPALIISLGLGLRIGMFILHPNKKADLKYALENSLKVFLFVIIPLLLIAGIIETLLIFFVG